MPHLIAELAAEEVHRDDGLNEDNDEHDDGHLGRARVRVEVGVMVRVGVRVGVGVGVRVRLGWGLGLD